MTTALYSKNYIAIDKAEEVAREHGRNPFAVARALGFRLFYERLPSGCQEMVLPDLKVIFLRPEARRNINAARRLVAHALGHVYLHTGNQLYRDPMPAQYFLKHEQQAEAFATALMFGPKAGESV